MGQVFRDITISFDGAEYTITPSNRLLRSIDAGLVPDTLISVAQSAGSGWPLPALAYITSRLIESAGGKADEDQVYAVLFHDVTDNEAKTVRAIVSALNVILAPPKPVKNS